MNFSTLNTQKAFSLIEVMVAVVVTVVGILAIAKFQGTMLQSGSNANQRAIASTIAERKLEKFKSLIASGGFDTIVSSTTASMETEVIGDAQYEMTWAVQNYYFHGQNQAATTMPTTAVPDYKQIEFTLSWVGLSGPETIQLSAVINSMSGALTGIGPGVGISSDPPLVFYNPLFAPDVIPVEAGPDIMKETSTALPDATKKGGSVSTAFEVVTYLGSTTETLRREEFLNLSCGCNTTGATGNRTEGTFEWDEEADILRDVRVTTSGQKFGTSKDLVGGGNQPFECTICCENKEPVVTSGDYVQVCRLKRIDGLMTVVPDWKLVSFDLIPNNFFDKDAVGMTTTLAQQNITAYSNYVIGQVRSRLDPAVSQSAFYALTSVSTIFHTTTMTTNDNTGLPHPGANEFVNGALDHKVTQVSTVPKLSARAVYMDFPPIEIYGGTFTGADVPLKRVPFFNVNATQQAAWIPDGDSDNDPDTLANTLVPDPGDTNFTGVGSLRVPPVVLPLTDYAQALVTEGAPPGHPVTGIHDPLVSFSSTSSVSECNSSILRNCVTDEELRDKAETVFVRGNFYANILFPTTVTTRIKKSTSGLTDTVQNGFQNVIVMPLTFSSQTVDSTVIMTVIP